MPTPRSAPSPQHACRAAPARIPAWVFAVALTVLVAAVLGLGLQYGWKAHRWPAVESPPKQGEAAGTAEVVQGILRHDPAALARVVREPQNTWSNLAFVFVGALTWAGTSRRIIRAAAGGLILTGVGSFLYHASASLALRALDVGAMQVYFGLSMIAALAVLRPRWRETIEQRAVLLSITVVSAAALITPMRGFKVGGLRPFDISWLTLLTALIVTLALASHAGQTRRRGPWLVLGASVLLLATAVMFQFGDRPGGWCWRPGRGLQGHALWHILSAAAAGLGLRQLEAALRPDSIDPSQSRATR
jgi:hypothetical protein